MYNDLLVRMMHGKELVLRLQKSGFKVDSQCIKIRVVPAEYLISVNSLKISISLAIKWEYQ